MPLLRHVATAPAAPLASTIQPCSRLYRQPCSSRNALSRPTPPPQRQQLFHTTSPLRDDRIDNSQNHYETLKLEPSATPAEVKKSFYALSKKHHPDLHRNDADRPAASRRFMRISEAYAILSVPAKRRSYDRDTLHLDQQPHQDQPHGRHHRPAGSYHSSSTNPAGGRPASGLSRRRGTFQGPPPSFFRSGGWGAQGAKRKAAHDDSATGAGPMGGTNPGQDPLRGFRDEHEDVPPHFDRAGHVRTGRRGDARRAAKQREGQQEGQWEGQGQGQGQKQTKQSNANEYIYDRVTPMPEDRGMAGMFFVIGGVVLLSFLGPFVIGRLFGWNNHKGGESGRGTTRSRKTKATATKREVAVDGS